MARLSLIAMLLLVSACSTHINAPDAVQSLPKTGFSVVNDVVFTPGNWDQDLAADIYLPDLPGLRPAVLMVHGGGWERRSRSDMDSVSKTLAKHGFVVMNVSYRFAPQHPFPAQIRDLQQAMYWMHQHAENYRIDTQRIAAFGYSAGAHLVSLMALVAGQGGELDGGEMTRPVAVVAGGTPSDLRKFSGGTLVPQFLGGTLNDIPEVFAQASPVVHVHPDSPPFFIYHGGGDLLVPPDHATDFFHLLQNQGNDAELLILKLRGHIATFFSNYAVMPNVLDFLAQHLHESS